MAWNEWLADYLMAIGRWQAMIFFLGLMLLVVIVAGLSAAYYDMCSEVASCRIWAQRTAGILVGHIHQRTIFRVTFDLRGGGMCGTVRIEGRHTDFICDCRKLLVSFPQEGVGPELFALFVGYSDKQALLSLMRQMRELAEVNGAWLDYSYERRYAAFYRSAKIYRFDQAA